MSTKIKKDIGYVYDPKRKKYVTDDGICYGAMEQAEEHVKEVNQTKEK